MSNKDPVTEKLYIYHFLIAVSILIAGTVWAIWDEAVTRRPWKYYQQEFLKNAKKKYTKDLIESKKAIDSKEYKKLYKEYQEACNEYDQNEERKKKVLELEILNMGLDSIMRDFRTSHSMYQALVYKMEKNPGIKEEMSELIRRLESDVGNFRERLMALENRKHEIQNELKKIGEKKEAFKKELEGYTEVVQVIQRSLDSLKNTKVEIKQVVNSDMGVIDRCMSCHIGIDKTGFENMDGVLETHPAVFFKVDKNSASGVKRRKDILGVHPVEKFGCVLCHRGQGYATTTPEEAHGEVRFWLTPMLSGRYLQSSCLKCHDKEVELPGAEIAFKGKRFFVELGCIGCHTVKGIETDEKKVQIGPDLTQIQRKVYPDWLVQWLKNPNDFRHDTRMPDFRLTHQEAREIASYLWQNSKEEESGYKNVEMEIKNSAGGKEIFEQVGCLGCHRVGEKGNRFGPDLSRIGEKVRYEYLIEWLMKPKKYQPKTVMPDLRLTRDEAERLAAYLVTLKTAVPDNDGEILNDPKEAEAGYDLISRYGCFGCHSIKGMENKGKVGAELTTIGSKPVEQFDFGLIEDEITKGAGIKSIHDNVGKARQLWLINKLKNPRVFDSGRYKKPEEKLRMPDFHMSDEIRDALVIFLSGLTDEKIPISYKSRPSDEEMAILGGERLIRRYNCTGCHQLDMEKILLKDGLELEGMTKLEEEGLVFFQLWQDCSDLSKKAGENVGIPLEDIDERKPKIGGDIVPIIAEGMAENKGIVLQEALAFTPPVLYGEGKKVQPLWLFDFLQNPVKLRPWLTVRMPIFGIDKDDATVLTKYFMSVDKEVYPYLRLLEREDSYRDAKLRLDSEYYTKAKNLMDSKDVNCISCHVRGDVQPSGDPSGWAPDMTLAHKRLKPLWIEEWLKDPQKLQPGTKMPKFPWEQFDALYPGTVENRIGLIKDYLMNEEEVKRQ